MTASGDPPAVDTKYEFVHNVGIQLFKPENSWRKR
jgi:hypothetical protein